VTAHPGSAALAWCRKAKDVNGYAPLSSLVSHLKDECGIESIEFLKRMTSDAWFHEYGWRLELHPYAPNRVKIVEKVT